MRVAPLSSEYSSFYIISHQNITERKLAEEEVLFLSTIDGLTGIPNRRHFDEFLNSEWRRCLRLGMPITLAIVDIDHFKILNDTYGHLAGDDCLKRVGEILKKLTKRPSDICARYGGEEFAIVLGNTGLENSLDLMNQLFEDIRDLGIPNVNSPVSRIMTVSAGVATVIPDCEKSERELIAAADRQLYCAKNDGRDRISCNCQCAW